MYHVTSSSITKGETSEYNIVDILKRSLKVKMILYFVELYVYVYSLEERKVFSQKDKSIRFLSKINFHTIFLP